MIYYVNKQDQVIHVEINKNNKSEVIEKIESAPVFSHWYKPLERQLADLAS